MKFAVFYYLDIWQCARYFVAALFKELSDKCEVSVSAFMTKSRSCLEIWARSRRFRSRLHHW